MSNITSPRDAVRVDGEHFDDPVKAGVKLIKGAMYGIDSAGRAVNMESGVAATARGEVCATVDNTDGEDGDLRVEGRSGVFRLHILGSSALVAADAYPDHPVVYFQDNHTVAKSSNTGARPKAGRLITVEGGMAHVAVGPLSSVASPDGDLVAANNLSDVADPDAARQNLGALMSLQASKISSKASDAEVARFVAPADGVLESIKTVLNGALATADATVTAAINGTPVTGGAVTITQAGSAAGDRDSATPSAANTFSEGDLITLTVGGGSTATGTLNAELVLSY